jgi:outer membrane receptor protein involved in Fe transport
MRRLTSLFLFLFITSIAFSQTQTLKGSLKDSSENRNLVNTVVSVLSKKDSVLVKFTRADKEGKFEIKEVKEGNYILMITHPFMGDFFDNIEVKAEPLDLGSVYMTPKSKLLSEVIVKSGSPIKIKGDTLIYTADSFKVRAGANVEELLRRLPGITVDKSGQITAMGERVKKVLVDGEEFFGTDPGIATKNLRADAVQEVQVFDKKSDQAEFTGIDDGVRDKTINLKMKKMAGYFGKVELGGGLKDKYDNSAMANFFQNKRKVAGYAIMSNTGQTNLDWQDAQNYGGGPENMMTGTNDDGGMWISVSGGDDNYWGGRNGIPKNWNGGFHYSNKFNKDKSSFNSGYKYSKVISPGETRTYSQTFLPDTSWSNNSISKNYSSTQKNAFNMTVDFNIDSNNSIKWTSRVNNNNGFSRVNYYTETRDEQNDFINNSTRNSLTNTDKNNITSNLLWRHKFKKFARTISVTTDFGWTKTKSNGLLYSLNNFYDNGTLFERDTTDQQNINENNNNTISTKIAYTEPLRKDLFLELSYGLSYANSKIDRLTYIQNINGKYDEPVDSLSNRFVFNNTQNTPGVTLRLNKKKYSLSFGSSVSFNQFEQKNLTNNTITNYSFTNFIPRASYTYKIKPNESLRINYNGSTTAPSPEQLQPTRVNTDPLNIYVGNPDLKQSFRHNINGGYNFYNVLKEKNMYTNLSFSMTDNAFVQSSVIDDNGKRTYKTVNTDGVYSINFYSDYGFKIKGTKWRTGFGPTFNFNRRIEFVNGFKNINNTKAYGLNLNINQYVPDKMNAYFSTELSWNDSRSSLNTNANADYWQIEIYGNLNKTVKKFTIGTDVAFEARQKDPRFPQKNSFTRLNASLARRFLKDDKLELKFQVNDILNENRGYDRNFSSYSYTETFYNTLRRFWLLTATWNISKNGKPSKMF